MFSFDVFAKHTEHVTVPRDITYGGCSNSLEDGVMLSQGQVSSEKKGTRGAKQSAKTTTKLNIPEINFLSEIITKIDEDTHDSLLRDDASKLFSEYLFPLSFPWHSPRIDLLPHIPRDVDEMHGIIYAGKTGKNEGKKEMFREVNRGRTGPEHWGGRALSRRADDEGVVELRILHPEWNENLPRNLLGNNITEEEAKNREEMLQASALAEVAPYIPWRWDGPLHSKKGNTKTWQVSVKVANVTSRHTLFTDFSKKHAAEHDPKISNKRLKGEHKPLLCRATYPAFVQSGRCVTVDPDTVLNTQYTPNSYLCRPNIKKEKNKRIRMHVGRNRRIWTSFRDGVYVSLISGQKLEAAAYKRPRDAKVAVRVNGNLFAEEDTQILQPKVLEHQTDTKSTSIDASDKWSFSNALCTLDRIELLYKLMECARREQKKLRPTSLSHKSDGSQLCIPSYSKMEHGMTNTFRQVPPRFHCVPLDDGFIRTLCVSPGSMASLSIHSILNNIAKKDRLCTVCWTPGNVQECFECNLLVHPECCLDRGHFISNDKDFDSQSNETLSPHDNGDTLHKPIQKTYNESSEMHANKNNLSKWQCAVCWHQKKPSPPSTSTKPRRSLKLPSRFVNNEAWELPRSFSGKSSLNGKKPKHRPNHKCSLCPHTGGAMSRMGAEESKGAWVHEFCRIWCCTKGPDAGININFKFKAAQVCALCGKTGKLNSHCEGKKNDSNIDNIFNGKRGSAPSGLVKCAAKGCFVTFHPLCTLLTTKFRAEDDVCEGHSTKDSQKAQQSNLAQKKLLRDQKKDLELCKQYTFKLLQVKRTERSFGCFSGHDRSCIVPVVFCGLHNPRREHSYFGCPPKGGMFGSAIRIPTMQLGKNHEKMKEYE